MNTQHQPIRVLHVVTTMEVGGVETLLMNLYRQMDRTKIQFDFLKHRGGSDFYDDQIRALGGRIFPGIPYDPLHIQKYRAYYNRFFREHPEYRIVHAHTHYNAVVLDEARKQGVPVRIAHAHIAYPTVDKKYIFKLWNKLTVRRSCTHMMACSHPAGVWFFGKKAAKTGQVLQVHNGMDAAKYRVDPICRDEVRRELGLEDQPVLIQVARMEPQKNHGFMLEVFQAFLQQHPDGVLLLAGDGTLRLQLEEKARDLGISQQVRFLGVRADVPRLLQGADVFVFPSKFEGLGLAAVEAQAAGLPCVLSDAIPHEVAITPLVQWRSLKQPASQWAEAVEEALAIPRQDALQKVVDAGYDISTVADKLQDFYLERAGEL